MNDFQKIKARFLSAGIIEQLIYINVAVYGLSFIFWAFKEPFINNWFSLELGRFLIKPWSIITYGFLHNYFIHLLGNIIALYYFGHLFRDYFSRKNVINFYLYGTVLGGIFFLGGYALIPNLGYSVNLVGASAGVSALLIGIATYLPNFEMRFALIGNIKLKHIAIFWIAYCVLLITANNNLGGNLAHIGGALFGFGYVKLFGNKDFSFDIFKSLFQKKSPLKTVYKANTKQKRNQETQTNQEKIDEILDKIGKSGYNALTKEEKDFLFKQGK